MNERLREAMAASRIDIEGVAVVTGVNPKTVQRWLSGRVPHGRHRWAVAELVGEDEGHLWPPQARAERGAVPSTELVAAYTNRAEIEPRQWWDLLENAQQRVDVLGYAALFLVEQHPHLPALLGSKAADACEVRIALLDPDSDEGVEPGSEGGPEEELRARMRTARRYVSVLEGCPGIRLHYHRTPLHNSLFRSDGQMFVTPHLYGMPGYAAPLLHLRRNGGDGIFDRFAAHFEAVWSTSTEARTADRAI